MKIRESGMPERKIWESFFDPERVLTALGLNHGIGNVVEFGCGCGTFTIPVAQMIAGKVFAFDIDEDVVAMVKCEADNKGLKNLNIVVRDFIRDGTDLPSESIGYVMLFNILHLENPEVLLSEANRILINGGKVGIVHWNYDPLTPRGPSLGIRPKPEQCVQWAERAGFMGAKYFDFKPFHYGIVMEKI